MTQKNKPKTTRQKLMLRIRFAKASKYKPTDEIIYAMRALTHMRLHARAAKKRAAADAQWASRALSALSSAAKKCVV